MKLFKNLNKKKEKKKLLLESEAYTMLSSYNINFPEFKIANSVKEVQEVIQDIGFPVVMKILSQNIVHKTDVGGVITDINNEEQAVEAFRTIKENIMSNIPEVEFEGVIITEQVEKGIEVIIGMIRDPQFGPTIMFGLGGIFIEILKDVSFRICPVNKQEVEEMISEIKGQKLLAGYRGQSSRDLEKLAEILLNISTLAMENENISEIDLNPVFIYQEGAYVVDAKIFIYE